MKKIAEEELYDGFYAVCTNLDDNAESIVRINHKRREIEECFRIMKEQTLLMLYMRFQVFELT